MLVWVGYSLATYGKTVVSLVCHPSGPRCHDGCQPVFTGHCLCFASSLPHWVSSSYDGFQASQQRSSLGLWADSAPVVSLVRCKPGSSRVAALVSGLGLGLRVLFKLWLTCTIPWLLRPTVSVRVSVCPCGLVSSGLNDMRLLRFPVIRRNVSSCRLIGNEFASCLFSVLLLEGLLAGPC